MTKPWIWLVMMAPVRWGSRRLVIWADRLHAGPYSPEIPAPTRADRTWAAMMFWQAIDGPYLLVGGVVVASGLNMGASVRRLTWGRFALSAAILCAGMLDLLWLNRRPGSRSESGSHVRRAVIRERAEGPPGCGPGQAERSPGWRGEEDTGRGDSEAGIDPPRSHARFGAPYVSLT